MATLLSLRDCAPSASAMSAAAHKPTGQNAQSEIAIIGVREGAGHCQTLRSKLQRVPHAVREGQHGQPARTVRTRLS
jgi:hypothetical protein